MTEPYMINIEGLNKADVLKALYDHAQPLGLGYLQYDPAPMTTEEAQRLLAEHSYFDYLRGRVMKLDLSSDTEFDCRYYDRDNHLGLAAQCIAQLRQFS